LIRGLKIKLSFSQQDGSQAEKIEFFMKRRPTAVVPCLSFTH